MKLLIGMMAFLAVGVTLSRMAVTRLGMSESDARLILYVTAAVWVLGMTIALVRWILARRAAAARNAKPVDPAIEALRGRIREARAGLKQLTRFQRSVTPRRPPLLAAPYPTPWLVVLGLPGHGKTALLGPTGAKRLVEIDREGPRKGPPDVVPEDRLRLFCALVGARPGPDLGGAAYLVSKAIKASRVVGFADLGMEAIYEFTVKDMPVTVAVDSAGTSVHQTGPKEWQARIGKIPVAVE